MTQTNKETHVVIDNEVSCQYYSMEGQCAQGNLKVRCDKTNKVFKAPYIQINNSRKKKIEFTHCPYCGEKLKF